jgi:hypothetical protein
MSLDSYCIALDSVFPSVAGEEHLRKATLPAILPAGLGVSLKLKAL